MTALTSGIFTRPTGAEFFSAAGCLINVGPPCATAGNTTPSDTTTPKTPAKPSDPNTVTAPSNPSTTPSDQSGAPTDTDKPMVALSTDVSLAGGATSTVNITGTVQDGNLASYSLTVGGAVAQQGSGFTDPSAAVAINMPWNLATPNVVPSGSYDIVLTATDMAGNQAVTTTTVEVDNSAPTTTVAGGTLIQTGSITPTVTATDAHGPLTYLWTAQGGNPSTLSFDASAMQPKFTPDIQGTYNYILSTSDALGNVDTRTFSFDYAPVLATVPLPTTTDPSDQLKNAGPIADATSTPTIRDTASAAQTDQAGASILNSTQGNIAAGVASAAPSASVISPTKSGWRILGIFWYWWVIVIGIFFIAWVIIKKVVLTTRFKAFTSERTANAVQEPEIERVPTP